MKINDKLKEYIEENIFPVYEKNEPAHNIDHIKYVIGRSFKFADTIPNINYDMVYTIASYKDKFIETQKNYINDLKTKGKIK